MSPLPDSLRALAAARRSRYAEAALKAGQEARCLAEGPGDASRVWACSEFVAESCTRYPDMLAELLDSGDLERPYAAGEDQAAMAGAMSAFFLSLMCLNEDEWVSAAPSLGFPPEERKNLQCVLDELGGPEGFAKTMVAGDEGDEGSVAVLFGAIMKCGVQIQGGPGGGTGP